MASKPFKVERGPEEEERGLKREIEGFLMAVVFPSKGALFFCRE